MIDCKLPEPTVEEIDVRMKTDRQALRPENIPRFSWCELEDLLVTVPLATPWIVLIELTRALPWEVHFEHVLQGVPLNERAKREQAERAAQIDVLSKIHKISKRYSAEISWVEIESVISKCPVAASWVTAIKYCRQTVWAGVNTEEVAQAHEHVMAPIEAAVNEAVETKR